MAQSQRIGVADLIFIIGVHEHINENKTGFAVPADTKTSWHTHMHLFVIYISPKNMTYKRIKNLAI